MPENLYLVGLLFYARIKHSFSGQSKRMRTPNYIIDSLPRSQSLSSSRPEGGGGGEWFGEREVEEEIP